MADKALPLPMRAVSRPLLLVSGLLHGLLLTAPWPSPTPRLEASSGVIPAEKAVAVATVRLEDLLIPAADSVPEPVSPPPVAPENSTAAPPPPRQSAPQPSADEGIVAPATSPDSAPPPRPAVTPPPVSSAPKIDPSDLQAVLSGLQGTATTTVEATPDLFTHPDAFFDGLATNTWYHKPDILRTAVVEATSPTQVFIALLANSRDSGFRSTQRADYGGGLVYEVVRQDQHWFFNLVPTSQGGTAIVVWAQVPG